MSPPRHRPRAAALVAAALALVACGCSTAAEQPSSASSPPAGAATSAEPAAPSSSASSPTSAVPTSSAPSVARPPSVAAATTLTTGLEVPWGLTFLPDGSALVAERRSGEVLRVGADGKARGVGRVPGVADRGEGGLLGLAVAPGTSTPVFAYLTTADDNRVVSLPFDGAALGRPTVLVAGIPSGGIHNGGRLVVGPDGRLYAGTGDGGERSRAQSGASLGGKILRLATDGSVPPDNPDPGSPIWSRGHRNVQGLAFDSAGRLWATEFGQNRFDELNLIRRGGNYGWPVVEGTGGGDRFIDPQVVWDTDQASPSGLAIVDDVAVVGALRGQRLWLVPLDGGRAGTPVAALSARFGRLRTVTAAPDGSLWVTTSNRDGRGQPAAGDDRILRVRLTSG